MTVEIFAPSPPHTHTCPQVCSNNGRCVCGQCKCRSARFDGPYCECNRDGCKRALDDDQVCGGPLRGECQCNGLCKCKPGYMSDRCDCMESQEQCFDPKNNSVRSPPLVFRRVCVCTYMFVFSFYITSIVRCVR